MRTTSTLNGSGLTTRRQRRRPVDPSGFCTRIHATRGLTKQIAQACGLTGSAVSAWGRVPAKHAHAVARVTGVDVEKIRPDIYDLRVARKLANGRGVASSAAGDPQSGRSRGRVRRDVRVRTRGRSQDQWV